MVCPFVRVLNTLRTGLGELTFLQLSTTYAPPSVAGQGVGFVSSPDTIFRTLIGHIHTGISHLARVQRASSELSSGGRFAL